MKKIILAITSLIVLLGLAACNSDEEATEEESTNTENETSNDESNDEEYLNLGDTAEIQSVVGDYNITVNSFELLDEFEGSQPSRDTYILVQFEVENIGDSPIVAEEIYGATIFDTEELSAESAYHYDSIEVFGDEEIQPGETKEGEYIFSHTESNSYTLHINYAMLDSVATNVTYELFVEDASN
ncbi:protein of unknown function [Gracilibacillus orientalis]|uniref:DUF4352 domain-containing protein n=1 Tax=Gracilibacillus orientalis TaxID=334253 RepID=A0A1I4P5N0_9BACI|nr:DUF4352 domain-containing protein [Gracilibacillus orientalis]SFM22860.1 protein of unknown function [Gracilibacillus orientalis]